MKKIIMTALILFGITGCAKLAFWAKEYPEDNMIEELVEELIKEKTGKDIDLSIFSKEKDEEHECPCTKEKE